MEMSPNGEYTGWTKGKSKALKASQDETRAGHLGARVGAKTR